MVAPGRATLDDRYDSQALRVASPGPGQKPADDRSNLSREAPRGRVRLAGGPKGRLIRLPDEGRRAGQQLIAD